MENRKYDRIASWPLRKLPSWGSKNLFLINWNQLGSIAFSTLFGGEMQLAPKDSIGRFRCGGALGLSQGNRTLISEYCGISVSGVNETFRLVWLSAV